MNVCIPIEKDEGLQSPICGHFGSAPVFLVVDTTTGDLKALENKNEHHAHGQCRPLAAVAGEQIDAIVVGGIGRGAFMGLTQAGVGVLLSNHRTVEEALGALAAGELRPVDPSSLCGGHSHEGGGGGCGGHDPA